MSERRRPARRWGSTCRWPSAWPRVIARWERDYLTALLAHAGGNVSEAARLARMDRNHLRERLRRYGLAPSRRAQ